MLKELLLLHICTASIFAGGEPHCSGRPRGPLLRTRSCTVENLHIFAILDYEAIEVRVLAVGRRSDRELLVCVLSRKFGPIPILRVAPGRAALLWR